MRARKKQPGAATELVLRDSRGVRGIQRLANKEPETTGPAVFQLYVLEVLDPDAQTGYEYYVGSTSDSPEQRLREHKDGGWRAWKKFKWDDVSPGALLENLTRDLPKFRCKNCAENAEGRLARAVNAQLGAAYSDRLDDRTKRKVGKCQGRT